MSKALEFCQLVNRKIDNDRIRRSSIDKSVRNDHPDIVFTLSAREVNGTPLLMQPPPLIQMELDDDDLWYLYEKYEKRLKKDYERESKELKDRYESVMKEGNV